MATTFETIQTIATLETSNYDKGLQKVEKGNDSLTNSSENSSKKSNVAFTSVAKVGLAAIATAAVATGVIITRNIGNAIDRIDTLVAFPRLLQTLGASTEEAQKSTDRLKTALQGLPTSLDAGARGVQRLVTAGVGVDKATEAYLGLNNAILASNGDIAQSESLFLQLSQAISRGSIEGQEWNTIAANLPTVLQALQNETGKTKNELEEMFKSDPQALLDNIIRLNKEGGGGIASLETQARQATGGIGTAFDNLNNAVTRGIEGLVKAIGDGGTDQEKLVSGQEKIALAVTNVGNAFSTALTQVGNFAAFIMRNQGIFGAFASAITAIVGAITLLYTGIKLVTIVQGIWNAVTGVFPGVWIALAIIGIVAAIIYLWNNVDGFRNFFVSAWDMILGAVKGVFNWVSSNWPLIVNMLLGPIAYAVGLIISNFDRIKQAAQNVWNWIRGTFSTIGEIGAGIVKAAVNSVLGFASRTINGFIRIVNGAIGALNNVPGVSIGNIGEVNIPMLAQGGIITSPTLAMIGEGREAEAVIPLSKLDAMLDNGGSSSSNNANITINLSGVMTRSRADLREVAKDLLRAVDEERTARGLSPINGGIA